MPDIISLVFASVLGIFYPIYLFIIRKKIKENYKDPTRKLEGYKSTILVQWIAVILVLSNFIYQGQHLSTIGLLLEINLSFLIGAGIILVATLVLFLTLKVTPETGAKLVKSYGEAYNFLPVNKKEYNWLIGVSFTAGICEEILYRGFLLMILIQFMHYIPAVLLMNIAFGMLHFWAGSKHALSAGLLGVFFSIIYFITGNLILSITLHVIVDIYAGTSVYKTNKILKSSALSSN